MTKACKCLSFLKVCKLLAEEVAHFKERKTETHDRVTYAALPNFNIIIVHGGNSARDRTRELRLQREDRTLRSETAQRPTFADYLHCIFNLTPYSNAL